MATLERTVADVAVRTLQQYHQGMLGEGLYLDRFPITDVKTLKTPGGAERVHVEPIGEEVQLLAIGDRARFLRSGGDSVDVRIREIDGVIQGVTARIYDQGKVRGRDLGREELDRVLGNVPQLTAAVNARQLLVNR